jgi:septum formation protein
VEPLPPIRATLDPFPSDPRQSDQPHPNPLDAILPAGELPPLTSVPLVPPRPDVAPLVLASSSPRRLLLLDQIGIVPGRVVSPDIDETPARDETPRLYARRMARGKLDAARCPGCFVLAADTVVSLGRRILPKAETPEQVRHCLQLLSGRRHHVMTGVALTAPDGRLAERLAESIVIFNRLTEDQIRRYVASEEGIGKAGGYAINGRAAGFIRFVSGSYSGVVGLPLFETAQLLRGLGYPVP